MSACLFCVLEKFPSYRREDL